MKKINQLITLILDFFEFEKRKIVDSKKSKNQKNVLILTKNPNTYHRFFYLFLKQFEISGYRIFYPMSFSKYRNIKHNNVYFGWIVNEPDLVCITNPKNKNNTITISDKDLSPDFFYDYFHHNNMETGYHFPMTFHPMVFHHGFYLQEIALDQPRINALYCFGNFEKESYEAIDKTPFESINRFRLLEFFSKKENFCSVKSNKGLQTIFREKKPNQIIFIEKENLNIPVNEVRNYLSQFTFFLACPGVVMPHCHNIIESMSVGTIPILQRNYAEQFYPALENEKNCIIFDDLLSLEIASETIFTFSEEKIRDLRERVLLYYQENLTPEKIVENIEIHLGKKTIYLNAEHRSVDLI